MKQKRWTRQWLSVLMALAILCSLAAPAAALGTAVGYDYYVAPGGTFSVPLDAQYRGYSVNWESTNPNISVRGDSTGAVVSASSTAKGGETAEINAYISFSKTPILKFSVCVASEKGTYSALSKDSLAMDINGQQRLEVITESDYRITQVYWQSSDPKVAAVSTGLVSTSATITAVSAGTARVDAYVRVSDQLGNFVNDEHLICSVTVSETAVSQSDYGASISPKTLVLNSTNDYRSEVMFRPDSALLNQGYYFGDITWQSSDDRVTVTPAPNQPFIATIRADRQMYATTATIWAEYPYFSGSSKDSVRIGTAVAYCTVTVGNKMTINATATLGETLYLSNAYTVDRDSIVSQIDRVLASDYNDRLTCVQFNNVTSTAGSLYAKAGTPYYDTYYRDNYHLADVYFIPSSTGTAEFDFTAVGITGQYYSGVLSITVTGKPTPDVLYAPARGQSQTLAVKDFSNFWHKTYPSGELSYVSFGSAVSGSSVGSLYYGNTPITGSIAELTFSSSSVGTGYRISDVSFIPTRSGSGYATGTLVIPFTATGTANTGANLVTLQGYLYITVPANTVSAIRYPATTTSLVSSDFTTVYRTASGASSANSNMYIQFLELPTNGALYVNYSGTSASRTQLTADNMGNYKFYNTAHTSTTNSISDVTYVPSSTARSGETIRYAAYNTSGDLQYIGTIEFAYMIDASVSYVSGIAGVTFRSVDFFGAGSPLEAGQYIAFGDPSSGKLYRNYVKGSGTSVTGTTYFSSSSSSGIYAVSDVTYVPNSNFAGTVTIPFTVYDANTSVGSGKVTIQVSSKSFVDAVDKTHWAYPFIYRLVAEGVVKGTDDTHFSPKKVVTNGEAIKMILLAVGYEDPGQGSGSAWAQPYIDMAYQKKIISSNEVPSAETITRETMVILAAKAMGLSPASSIQAGIAGPTDIASRSADAQGYIRAMYNAGIINGTGDGKFNPTSTLTREEMSKIVCLIMDYCDARA